MNSASSRTWWLPVAITVLALADGLLHLGLDFVLFRGNIVGTLGPPPGAPAGAPGGPPPSPLPLPLPLNQMFALRLVGYCVLVVLFWAAPRLLDQRRWLADLVLIVYVAVLFVAWLRFGAPNPQGLGYISKLVEIALLVALVAHAWLELRPLPDSRQRSPA